jgi:hypothetical protein
MNIVVKSAVAAVLASGASGAFALGVPDTNSSDLVLVVQNESNLANVYELDTGISINSVMPSTGLFANATLATTIAGINTAIQESSLLQAFLAANPAADDGYTIEAAQFTQTTVSGTTSTSAINGNSKTPGNLKDIFTSVQPASNIGEAGLGNAETIANGIQGDLTQPVDSLGLTPLQTKTEASTGTSYSNGPNSAATKYGLTGTSDLQAVGAAATLFGITGNGSPTNGVESYILGSVTLSTTGVLSITGNSTTTPPPPPVPLPAAVWLFGSGLLGLVGVSRRRKSVA